MLPTKSTMQESHERTQHEEDLFSGTSYEALYLSASATASGRDRYSDPWQKFHNNLESLIEKLWNDDVTNQITLANKELADLEDFREKQHEQLIQCRREINELKIGTEKKRASIESLQKLHDETASALKMLQEESEDLFAYQSSYGEKWNKAHEYNQQMSRLLEKGKCAMDQRKEERQRELQALEQKLKQEEEMTENLLKENERASFESVEYLEKEMERVDNDCQKVETKLEAALVEQQKINEHLASINKELADEEKKSHQAAETEAEMIQLKVKNEEKQASLNAEQIREKELQLQLKQILEEYNIESSEYKRLQQENSELEKQLETETLNRDANFKAFQENIKDLIVLKNQNRVKVQEMSEENSNIELHIQENTTKIDSILKSITDTQARILLLEKRNSMLAQESRCLDEELAAATTTLNENESSFQSLNTSLENIRKEAEERENQSIQETFNCKDKLDTIAIETEQMHSILDGQNEVIQNLTVQENILNNEWETLHEEVKSLKVQTESRSDEPKEDAQLLQLEETKKFTTEQIQVLMEDCMKVEEKQRNLLQQIEHQQAILTKALADSQFLVQETQIVESSILIQQAELSKTEEALQKRRQALYEKQDNSMALAGNLKELDLKISDLETYKSTTETTEEEEEGTTVYEKEAKRVNETLALEREKLKNLKQTFADTEQQLQDLDKSNKTSLKDTEKEIIVLKSDLKEDKEYIKICKENIDRWMKEIRDYQDEIVDGQNQGSESKELHGVATLRKEAAALKAQLECTQKETEEANVAELTRQVEDVRKNLKDAKKTAAETRKTKDAEGSALITELKKKHCYLKELIGERSKTAQAAKTPLRDPSNEVPAKQVNHTQEVRLPTTQPHTQPQEVRLPTTQPPHPRPFLTQPTSSATSTVTRHSPSDSSSSTSSIVLSLEDRQEIRREPGKISKIVAELRRKKRLKSL